MNMQDLYFILTMKKTIILLIAIVFAQTFTIDYSKSSSANPYDQTLSKKWAAFSSVTHCPSSCINSWTCKTILEYPKLINVTYIENSVTKAAGFIGYEPSTETLVTSWRGSSNAENWIEDFNFEKIDYLYCLGCEIHAGFWADYKSNQRFLVQAANTIIKNFKVKKIICTGQSLGGAIATINGIDFVHRYSNIPVEVHNFGSPRIGNEKLAHYLRGKIPTFYRVVHNKDLVPHLPFEAMGYRQIPFEVFYDEKMENYVICNESGEDPNCSNKFFPNFDTNDHDFYFMPIGSPKC